MASVSRGVLRDHSHRAGVELDFNWELVDLIGFDAMTSSMPWVAPSCAAGPRRLRMADQPSSPRGSAESKIPDGPEEMDENLERHTSYPVRPEPHLSDVSGVPRHHL
jgi:hypothetical protein